MADRTLLNDPRERVRYVPLDDALDRTGARPDSDMSAKVALVSIDRSSEA